jgi:hypothetical protein
MNLLSTQNTTQTQTQSIGEEAIGQMLNSTSLCSLTQKTHEALKKYDPSHQPPILIVAFMRALEAVDAEEAEIEDLRPFINNLAALLDSVQSNATYH